MNRRLSVGAHWLKGRKNGTAFQELFRFMLGSTCTIKAKSKIADVARCGDYMAIHLKGFEYPIYYPAKFDIYRLNAVIAEVLYPEDWHCYEIEETRVKPGDFVLDCGAAEGLFTLSVAKRAEKIYAVEPLPEFIKALGLTFASFNNVEILPVALSAASGKAYICEKEGSSFLQQSGFGASVEVSTIDDLFFLKGIPLTYIKADVEGSEVDLLKGAARTIKECAPRIAITTYHDPSHARKIADYLKNINKYYRIKVKGIDENTGSPIMLHAWV